MVYINAIRVQLSLRWNYIAPSLTYRELLYVKIPLSSLRVQQVSRTVAPEKRFHYSVCKQNFHTLQIDFSIFCLQANVSLFRLQADIYLPSLQPDVSLLRLYADVSLPSLQPDVSLLRLYADISLLSLQPHVY
jgi:hypothetical protein